MRFPRSVLPETLDSLSEDDPDAIRSRHDLRRIHFMMGTRAIILDALCGALTIERAADSLRILELGAGDGRIMLDIARRFKPAYRCVDLTLLDNQALVTPATISDYAKCGWHAVPKICDVFAWAAEVVPFSKGHLSSRWDLIICNLFLHHFENIPLSALLRSIAASADVFIACEPRRAHLALLGSHLVGLIGANKVTRGDAVLSVHAGFRGREISSLWPAAEPQWQLAEHPARLFTHCFRAIRAGSPHAN
jgi:hypothetical protein